MTMRPKTKIYTRTGDQGTTRLYDGTRVEKNSYRVEAYGTIDEVNATLAIAKNYIEDSEVFTIIEAIQRKLFHVAGELATTDSSKFPNPIKEEDIKELEEMIDFNMGQLDPDKKRKFTLPGSNKVNAYLHLARTICRRAERRIITLSQEEEVSIFLLKYVNRLSDAIYSIGRYLEGDAKMVDFNKKA